MRMCLAHVLHAQSKGQCWVLQVNNVVIIFVVDVLSLLIVQCVCMYSISVCVCVCEVTCVFPLVTERINHQQEACSSLWAQKTVEQQDVLRDMFYSPTSQFIFTSALSWCGCLLRPGCPSHCSAFIPECMNQYWTQRAENDATEAEYINETLITDAVKPVLDSLTSNLRKSFGEVFYYSVEKWWAGKHNTDF